MRFGNHLSPSSSEYPHLDHVMMLSERVSFSYTVSTVIMLRAGPTSKESLVTVRRTTSLNVQGSFDEKMTYEKVTDILCSGHET